MCSFLSFLALFDSNIAVNFIQLGGGWRGGGVVSGDAVGANPCAGGELREKRLL